MQKVAESEIWKKITDAIQGGWAVAKPGAAFAAGIGLTGGGILGAALGYAMARMTSPSTIAKNTDKELEEEALRTEIDVTQRRLAALEARRAQKQSELSAPRAYDRFV